jgi:hypothetical protein
MPRQLHLNHLNKSGYIYILSTDCGLVKIGRTTELTTRISSIQSSSPLKLKLLNSFWAYDCVKIEKSLHNRFALKCIHGEWFKLNTVELEYLTTMLGEDRQLEQADLIDYWIEMNMPLWGEL